MSLMLFTNVYDADLKTAFQPKLVLFTAAGVLAVAGAAFLGVRLLVKDPSRRAVLTQGIFRSNYVIFGIPVAANLYGEGNIATAALLSAVAVPMFNVLAVLTLEYYSTAHKSSWKAILKGVVTNPLILGAAAGLLMKLMQMCIRDRYSPSSIGANRKSSGSCAAIAASRSRSKTSGSLRMA